MGVRWLILANLKIYNKIYNQHTYDLLIERLSNRPAQTFLICPKISAAFHFKYTISLFDRASDGK